MSGCGLKDEIADRKPSGYDEIFPHNLPPKITAIW
jgi:hypothetical protein